MLILFGNLTLLLMKLTHPLGWQGGGGEIPCKKDAGGRCTFLGVRRVVLYILGWFRPKRSTMGAFEIPFIVLS